MKLTVLNVAYPFAPVGPDAVGGAEQVLSQLDFALTRAGHTSIVVASAGSVTAGTLVATTRLRCRIDEEARRCMREEYVQTIQDVIRRWPVDVVHMHGLDFVDYLPPPEVPVLATLHVPLTWYSADLRMKRHPRLFMHCVSESQRRTCPAEVPLLPDIPNGVDSEFFEARHTKKQFALVLGRICPEKGFHTAIDAAKLARVPLLMAGKVFRYDDHERYFEHEIVPRLDRSRRFIGPVGMRRKKRLLASAQCLLLPSTAAETSSLVTMEALASGTPVIAFPTGALPEIIEHGKTGFLVRDALEMAVAIKAAADLDPAICRARARERFSLKRMARRYFSVYRRLIENRG